ncbi:MAG: hypothetical protein K6F00_06355 [Lachnospiraceae bacterium]|nr:hypothetical protein [Lachnospiraceae bacterium]
MIAEEKIENAPSEVTFGYPVVAFGDLDPSGSETLLIVSQSRCTNILKNLLSLGIPKDRIIIWTPKLYLERSDYKLTVENDASVTAEMHYGSVNLKAALRAYSDFFVFEEIYLKNTYRFSVRRTAYSLISALTWGWHPYSLHQKDL